jgi:hypothetical protein
MFYLTMIKLSKVSEQEKLEIYRNVTRFPAVFFDKFVEQYLPGTSLRANQIEFAFYDIIPGNLKPMTLRDWAYMHNVTYSTVISWRLNKEFNKLKMDIIKNVVYNNISAVLDNISDRAANSSDPRWAELYLQFIAGWQKKDPELNDNLNKIQVNNFIITGQRIDEKLSQLRGKMSEPEENVE